MDFKYYLRIGKMYVQSYEINGSGYCEVSFSFDIKDALKINDEIISTVEKLLKELFEFDVIKEMV